MPCCLFLQKGLYLHENLLCCLLWLKDLYLHDICLPVCFCRKVCTCTKSAVLFVLANSSLLHEIYRLVCFCRTVFTCTKFVVLFVLVNRSVPARNNPYNYLFFAENSVPARNLPYCLLERKGSTCTKSAVLFVRKKSLFLHAICRIVCLAERPVPARNLPSRLLWLKDLHANEIYRLVCFG